MIREEYIRCIDARLDELLSSGDVYAPLRDAMRYSVTAGGKRIRPVLHLMVNAMLGGDASECLDDACAIELIHTYSLIHDDLPAMDNDSLRRGRPTSHIVFGEAGAILAGDGLLSFAFQVMLNNALTRLSEAERHLRAIAVIADGCGVGGMLSGQSADVNLEGTPLSDAQLRYIDSRKTGALITAAAVSGAVLAGAEAGEIDRVREYGDALGLAFQIVDDVLDVIGTAGTLGKNPGKDARDEKTTFVTLYGVQGAEKLARDSSEQALSALSSFGDAAMPLVQLTNELTSRRS